MTKKWYRLPPDYVDNHHFPKYATSAVLDSYNFFTTPVRDFIVIIEADDNIHTILHSLPDVQPLSDEEVTEFHNIQFNTEFTIQQISKRFGGE